MIKINTNYKIYARKNWETSPYKNQITNFINNSSKSTLRGLTKVRLFSSTRKIQDKDIIYNTKESFAPGALDSEKAKAKAVKLFKQNKKLICGIFFGSLLGGGCLEKSSEGSNAIFKISMTKNPKVAEYIYNLLLKFGYCNITTNPLQIHTYSLPSLNEIHELFYRVTTEEEKKAKPKIKYKKKIPENLDNYIDEAVLAFWFLQKGQLTDKGITLSIETKSESEKAIIVETLNKKFNLTANSLPKKSQTLLIPKKETLRFISFIKPYIHPSLFFKLEIIPSNPLTKYNSMLYLFFGSVSLTKTEIMEQLEQNGQLKIQDYAIVEYPFGENKASFDVFFSLKEAFDIENTHLLHIIDHNNKIFFPLFKKISSSKTAVVLSLLEQENAFSTFSRETLYTDFIEQFCTTPLVTNTTFFDELLKKIIPHLNLEQRKNILSNFSKDEKQKKSIFTTFSEIFTPQK